MSNVLTRFTRSTRGASAIEFAMIMPLMLLFTGGIVEVGRAFQAYSEVNRLATRYAIAWADCVDAPAKACQTELGLYTPAAALQNLAPQLNPASISVRMLQVNMVLGAPVVVYASPSGATLSPSNPNELTPAVNSIGTGNVGVVVTVQYQYSLMFFSKLMSSVFPNGSAWTISYTVAQRKT